MAVTLSARRVGTNADYVRFYLYEQELTKKQNINEPSTVNFSLTDVDGNMVKLVRGDYITIATPAYPKFFTGFIVTEGEYEYLGNKNGDDLFYGFKYKASSDEFVLSLRPIGIIPPYLNTTQGAILKSLVSILTDGTSNTFDVTGIQDGTFVAAFLPEPDKTFADIVKDFGDSANYRFYANDFKLYYEPYSANGVGQGKHFNGVDSYLYTPGSSSTYTAFTWAGWAKRDSVSATRNALTGRLFGPANGWCVLIDESNLFSLFVDGTYYSVASPDLSDWGFIAISFTSGAGTDQIKFYYGATTETIALIGTATKVSGWAELSTYGIKIGAATFGEEINVVSWNGDLDHVGLWNVELTLTELKEFSTGEMTNSANSHFIAPITGASPEPLLFNNVPNTMYEESGATATTGAIEEEPTVGSLLIDGQGNDFTPLRLDINTASEAVINDCTIFGDVEPQNYVTEYFVGDGFTAEFPLISDVYGVEKSVYLDETFSGTDLDSNKWIEVGDSLDLFIQVSNGLLQILGGNGNWDDVYVQALYPIPLEGNLRLTHGEFDFTAQGTAVICSLWTGTPSGDGTNFPDCVYGLKVSPSGANVQLQPIVNGVLQTDQSVIANIGGGPSGRIYTIRTLFRADEIVRFIKQRRFIQSNGNSGSYGNNGIPTITSIETIINEINRSTGELVKQSRFHNSNIGLDFNVLYALYTPIVSNDGHVTISNITVSTPLQAQLSVFKAGKADNSINYADFLENNTVPYGWKSRLNRYKLTDGAPIEFNITEDFDSDGDGITEKELVWQDKLLGPNEIDTLDGFAPLATIITDNSGKTDKGNVYGTPKYNSGSARLVFFKDSVKQTYYIPGPGDLIRIKYRRAGVAVGRARNTTSITAEALTFGDSGIRSVVKKDFSPPPRTSEECELVAAAFVQDFGYQHYEGTYTQFSTSSEFTGLPMTGTLVIFQNLPAILPQFQVELILEVDSTIVVDAAEEVFLHKVKFGKTDKVKKLLSTFAKPRGFISPEDAAQIPSAFDVVGNASGPTIQGFIWDAPALGLTIFDNTTYETPVYAPSVKELYLHNWTSSPFIAPDQNVFNFKIKDGAPEGGGFETRYTDIGWGNLTSSNIVPGSVHARGSAQSIRSFRNLRGKVIFVKAFDADGRYSRYAATVRAEFPDIPPPANGIIGVGGDLARPIFKANLPVDGNGDPRLNTSIYGIEASYAHELDVTSWFLRNGATFGTTGEAVSPSNYPVKYKISDTNPSGLTYLVSHVNLPATTSAFNEPPNGGYINFDSELPIAGTKCTFFLWVQGTAGATIRLNIKDDVLGSFNFYSRTDIPLTGLWQGVYTKAQIPVNATGNFNLVIQNVGSIAITDMIFTLPFILIAFHDHADIVLGASQNQPGLQFTYNNSPSAVVAP